MKEIFDFLLYKYKTDKYFRETTFNSVKKILNYKLIYFKKYNKISPISIKFFDIKQFNPKTNFQIINNEQFKKINRIISYLSIKLNKDRKKIIPLSQTINLKNTKFVIITSKKIMYKEVQKYVPFYNIKYIYIKPFLTDKPTQYYINNILNQIDKNSYVIFGLLNKNQVKLIKHIYKKNKNIIVINLLHHYNIKHLDIIDTIISTYSDKDYQIKSALKFLFKKESYNKYKSALNEIYLTF